MARLNNFAKPEFYPQHVLITGASGGLGQALARHFARSGTHLTLWGQNEDRLQVVAKECCARGGDVSTHRLTLTDLEAAIALFRNCDEMRPVDLMILNAGVSPIRSQGSLTETAEAVREVALVNYASPVTLATAAAEAMARRRSGHIAMIGSVAAHHDLPFATAYSSSKAGLARFSTCLHAALAPLNVHVTLIEPGYIDTVMSRRLDGGRPFLVSAEKAAERIASAIANKKVVLVFPRVFLFLRFLSAVVPRPVAHRLLRRAKVTQDPLPR